MAGNKSLLDALKAAQGQPTAVPLARRSPDVARKDRKEQATNFETDSKTLATLAKSTQAEIWATAEAHPKFSLAKRSRRLNDMLLTQYYPEESKVWKDLRIVRRLEKYGESTFEALKNPELESGDGLLILQIWLDWARRGGVWCEAMSEAVALHLANLARAFEYGEEPWRGLQNDYGHTLEEIQKALFKQNPEAGAVMMMEIAEKALSIDDAGFSGAASKEWNAALASVVLWAVNAAESSVKHHHKILWNQNRLEVPPEEMAQGLVKTVGSHLASISSLLQKGRKRFPEVSQAYRLSIATDPASTEAEIEKEAARIISSEGALACAALMRHPNSPSMAVSMAAKKSPFPAVIAWDGSITNAKKAGAALTGMPRDRGWDVLLYGGWARNLGEKEYQEVLLAHALNERSRNPIDISNRLGNFTGIATEQTKDSLAAVCGGGVSSLLAVDETLSQKARVLLSFNPDTLSEAHAVNWLYIKDASIKEMSSASLLAAWNMAKGDQSRLADYGFEGLKAKVQLAVDYLASSGASPEVIITLVEKNLISLESAAATAKETVASVAKPEAKASKTRKGASAKAEKNAETTTKVAGY